LARLTTRAPDDVTVALLDSVATVADILTFYQERIANEGYLRTALERRSVLELARAIGYELSPGVAAAVHLSFLVEDAPGAPLQCLIPKGTQVQSVPPQGKLPQVFETTDEFLARAEWNVLRPRQTRPADMALLIDGDTRRIVLLVPAGTVPPGDGVFPNVADASIRRLDGSLGSASAVDAVELKRIYFTESAAGLSKGDVLLFAGGEGEERVVVLRRVAEVVAEPERKRVRVDVEALTGPSPGATAVGYRFLPKIQFATVRLSPVVFNAASIDRDVVSQTWRERDLQALIGIQRWSFKGLVKAVNTAPPPPPAPPASGAFAFRDKAGFFGSSAPKWGSLPKPPLTHADPYPLAWDAGDGTISVSRTIWQDSQGQNDPGRGPQDAGPHAFLERTVGGLASGSWIVIESPFLDAATWTIHHSQDLARADFGISGRTTALTLGESTTGNALTTLPDLNFRFRDSTAHLNSRRLDLAELPIEAPVDAESTAIEVDRMVLGLVVGQPIIVAGERADTPGVEAAEVALISDVIHAGGVTTLILSKGLQYGYVRSTNTISANVVHATHGETVNEVLGGGDASIANQSFVLSRPPLTYASAPTPRGVASTLVVRINGVSWTEVPSLYGVPADEPAYVVRIDDDARARITFGDGTFGARTVTGATNVTASYRCGIGPDGEVDAGSLTLLRTMPLGLRSVTNSLPARGAEAHEKLADARRNAPLTVLTFGRVVSLPDFENFARTFPGIGKAAADVLSVDGESIIHLTVAGATGGEPGIDTLANLTSALGAAGDLSQRILVNAFAQRYFTADIQVVIDPRYIPEVALAAVESEVRDAFSFEAREFGQSVTPAEVLKTIHQVPGVVAAHLQKLEPYSESGESDSADDIVPVIARRASWNAASRRAVAAELLLVNPVGITVGVMEP
jgi:hypothetical protein